MEAYRTDVVIIGSGGAGLRAAIAAAVEGRKTLLVSRGSPALGSATLLSDGFFSSSGPGMSAAEHARLTMETGYHRNKPELVKVLVEEARPRIDELARHGARFTEESGGVRIPRRKCATGMSILNALKGWAAEAGVTSMGWTTVVDLLMDGDRVIGCYALTKGRPLLILAGATILCTGGASALFLLHDNPITSLGDGYAIAARAGAALEDMEFIQFYPLVTNEPGTPRILILPPLIDLGKIINDQGEDLVEKYGLAPFRPLGLRARDRLSRALFQEHLAGRRVSLDLRAMTEGDWQDPLAGKGLQTLFETRYHYRIGPISIMPAAHFTMGGIPIDEYGKTALEGLFAAGEVTCGLHGANRLGGNALSETLVFGARAGMAAAMAAGSISRGGEKTPDAFVEAAASSGDSPLSVLTRLKETLWKYCGPVRTGEGLALGTDILGRLEERTLAARKPGEASLRASVRNALLVARKILDAAQARKEGLGAHYRED
jgi:succinate dehydrogenase/fumarate reductase flavoprotein subunit